MSRKKTPTHPVQSKGTSTIKSSATGNNPPGEPNPKYSHAQNTGSGGKQGNVGRENLSGGHMFFDSPSDRMVLTHNKRTQA